jgi:glutamyl-Q tRNA(Asp) synthetase
VASYCDAKHKHGKWLVRMEDLDKTREVVGAADDILRTLEAFGFEWDSNIIYQSQRHQIYADAFNQLKRQNRIYPCTCTRKEIADSSNIQGIDGLIYPNTCKPKFISDQHAAEANIHAAYRLAVEDNIICFTDAIQGEVCQNLTQDIGDFIVKRKDGFFAYQLAVVVDDAMQGVNHVVRGADLLDSTPRQIYIQQLLGYATPHYAHVPIATNAAGEKLSKQTLAKPIKLGAASAFLFEALCFLGQNPPIEIKDTTLAEMWRWAIANWTLDHVPKNRSAPLPALT